MENDNKIDGLIDFIDECSSPEHMDKGVFLAYVSWSDVQAVGIKNRLFNLLEDILDILRMEIS